MSIGGVPGDSILRHVFEHMNERVSILDEAFSHYAEPNYETKIFMELNHSISMLKQCQESELVELVSLFTSQIKDLDRSIGLYIKTRSANSFTRKL